jgi:outer membrane protein assembly factor BamD (BamD/ComL family)
MIGALIMNHTARIVLEIFLLVVFVALVGWAGFRALKQSDEPRVLILKWVLTAITLGVLFGLVIPATSWAVEHSSALLVVPLVGAICAVGLVLTAIWRRNIASFVAKPFGSLYDGGDLEVEPKPLYSIARTKRNRGRFDEAIQELRKQLEKFPTDFEAQHLLASIQAENQFDLLSAQVTIYRLCQQPGHPPGSIAYALNSLADWQLKFCQDRDAAREALEKIIALMPDSEMSALAAQRIAHLANTEHLLEFHDPRRIALKPGVQDVGLLPPGQAPKAPELDPATQAADYIRQLEAHPLDTEVREKLAALYADHYGRLDLAVDQMEQLISHPGQPSRRVVHWLNLLADLQIRHGADYETIRQTVQRIVDLYPGSNMAQTARSRLDHLKLELKGKEKSPTVRMGTYEQNIGLKRGLPNQL